MLPRLAIVLFACTLTHASDWTTHRADIGRTGWIDADLPDDLAEAWSLKTWAPSPAWPNPARRSFWQNLDHIEPRVIDDRALHPVIVGDRLLVASSTEDALTCHDLHSGEVRWKIVTDGPVRFAPAVEGDRIAFGSDDGLLRCVDLDGRPLWTRRVGPDAPWIPGNGRIVSPFPIRTGVLVDDGVVYATAGLFPSQGVHVVACDLTTGEPAWTRTLEDRSPQGYLLATDDLLVLPGGRANPFALRRADGTDGPAFGGVGGTYALIADNELIAGRGNDNTVTASDLATGSQVVSVPGRHLVVTGTTSWAAAGNRLGALDRVRDRSLRRELAIRRATLKRTPNDPEAIAAVAETEKAILDCVLWTREIEPATAMIGAGDDLVVASEGRLRRIDRETGTTRAEYPISGAVLSIAATDDALVATTDDGRLTVWTDASTPRPEVAPDPVFERSLDTTAARRLDPQFEKTLDNGRGYVVFVEPTSIAEITHAIDSTDARIVVVAHDPERRDAIRDLIDAPDRCSVHLSRRGTLPFADHVANLVICDDPTALASGELERVAIPGRGLVNGVPTPPLEGAGTWTHQFADLGNSANGDDAHTTSDLALQWFGGPGPERMIDRHMRGPPPLASGGRVFMVGEHRVIAVDAWNGTELWDTPLPDSQRYALPYDAGYIACDDHRVYAAVDESLHLLDASTGAVVERRLPPEARADEHWGYVGVDGPAIYGTTLRASAPRTEPGRSLADSSYRSNRPVVTSTSIFRTTEGDTDWTRRRGAILNPTITVTDGLVCFIESRHPDSVEHPIGRLPIDELARDAHLVALDAKTGELRWERPVDLSTCRNIVYLAGRDGRLFLVGSSDSADDDAAYHVRAFRTATGEDLWHAGHANLKPGQLYHGEQVHHPVILDDALVAEPFIYDLETGAVRNPDAPISRPGHSCGTMSGARDCVFFRANNPTVLDLTTNEFTRLSPSRVGCWINILPAQGLVLIPEASASCVCHYALQTSMAFRPR